MLKKNLNDSKKGLALPVGILSQLPQSSLS